MAKTQAMFTNVLQAIIVAVVLGVGSIVWSKFESYETMSDTLPQLKKDLIELRELHDSRAEHDRIEKEFQSDVDDRLGKIESRRIQTAPSVIRRLEALEKMDELHTEDILMIRRRQDHLKKYHE